MREIFLVLWSGGYEEPSIRVAQTSNKAESILEDWQKSGFNTEEEYLQLLKINLETIEIEVLHQL